jgi:hypothetical protein
MEADRIDMAFLDEVQLLEALQRDIKTPFPDLCVYEVGFAAVAETLRISCR